MVALRLFERRGYERVTMADVARAASISRRTLFRSFPTKAHLVWEGLDEVLASLRDVGAIAGRRGVLEVLLAAGLTRLEDRQFASLARRRLRVIASAPESLSHPALAGVERALAEVLAARGERHPDLAGRALFAVGFATVLWWVEHEGALTMREALDESLRALSELRRPAKRRRR